MLVALQNLQDLWFLHSHLNQENWLVLNKTEGARYIGLSKNLTGVSSSYFLTKIIWGQSNKNFLHLKFS